jgi:DNA replication protein DnaC
MDTDYTPLPDWELTEDSLEAAKPRYSTAAEYDAILFGDKPCPRCNGTHTVNYAVRDKHTGNLGTKDYQCLCSQNPHRRKTLAQMLPPKYLRCNLATLEPSTHSTMPIQRQAEMIQHFRENPNANVMMWGKPGTGKTTVACALLRHAVQRDWKYFYTDNLGCLKWTTGRWIWRVSFDTLMAQYLRKQNDREEPEPDVTPERIKAATEKGKKFVLCLEEIDKAKLTEHRANKLFDIIDTLYNCEGQLIVTTNLTHDGFSDMMTKTDNENINVAGAAIIRRIEEMCEIYEF